MSGEPREGEIQQRVAVRRGEPAPAGTRLDAAGGQPAESAVGEDRLAATERLAAFAEAHGHTLLELALSWLAAHAQVASVIAGATSPAQILANVAATSAWTLTEEELAAVERLTAGP